MLNLKFDSTDIYVIIDFKWINKNFNVNTYLVTNSILYTVAMKGEAC